MVYEAVNNVNNKTTKLSGGASKNLKNYCLPVTY